MSSARLMPLIFRGFVFLPQRLSHIAPTLQPFRSFASYAPRSRKNSKTSRRHSRLDETGNVEDLPQGEKAYRRPQYHFNPQHSTTSEYPAIVLSHEEKEISVAFLKKVVDVLEERGRQFLLPWGDADAIEKVLDILRELQTATGLQIEFLFDAFTLKPDLFAAFTRDGSHCIEILDCLCDLCGFSIEDSIRIFGNYTSELLETPTESISQRLSTIISFGIKPGYHLAKVVRRCPAILFAIDQQKMAETLESLANFFNRKQLVDIITNDPEIAIKNFDLTEELYEYIYYHMRFEPEDFTHCRRWAQLSLDEVMQRHQFLMKTGKYELPDPKKPQLKEENPPLYRILDTNDENFAIQVAKVSLEEWMLFKQLSAKLEALEDKDRPFERIKPSMRKAFERRLKEKKESEDYVFDG